MKHLSFGIVNYNGGDALLRCIESIEQQLAINTYIFIWDNASSDNSIDLLQAQKKPNIHITHSKTNDGYGYACNRLIEKITDNYLVLANMDIIFDPLFGSTILNFLQKNKQVQSIAPLFIHQQEQTINWAGTRFYKDFQAVSVFLNSSLEQTFSTKKTFGGYGATMVLNKKSITKVGGFNENYFLFYEETDFYWKMELMEIPTYFLPEAKVYHFRSLSTIRFSKMKLYYSERNRILSAFKYSPLMYFPKIFFYSALRFYTLKTKMKYQGKQNTIKMSSLHIIIIILCAWISAILKSPYEYKKRQKFWKMTTKNPIDTLKLLDKYSIPFKDIPVQEPSPGTQAQEPKKVFAKKVEMGRR